MKKYKEYMDSVRASDTLHQRLLGLETSGKRPVTWKKYGAMAAALALVLGLGAWWLGREEVYDPRLVDYAPVAPEIADEPVPDIALVEPGDVTEPGEKTIGGYEVVSGSGENAMVTYYILPYIEYGDTSGQATAADWDIPRGAVRRDLTQDEIIALMGGEDAVNTHLDWGEYQLTGWAAWCEDGSFWGAYIDGHHREWSDTFEFAVTAGQLPPTCFAYPSSVTQEIRGLTVTADKYDWELGEESLTWIPERRVSFFKDNCGYRFVMTSGDTSLAEKMVSRLVCRIADEGLGFDLTNHFAQMRPGICDACGEEIVPGTNHFHTETYVCTYCGHVFPTGTAHSHAFIGADATYTCDLCGNTFPVGTAHTHPYDPNGAADPAYDAPAGYTCPDCGVTIPVGEKHYHTQDETHTCSICGEVLPIDVEHAHELCTLPVAPSDTPATYTCGVCGQTVQNGAAHSHSEDHHSDHHGGHH